MKRAIIKRPTPVNEIEQRRSALSPLQLFCYLALLSFIIGGIFSKPAYSAPRMMPIEDVNVNELPPPWEARPDTLNTTNANPTQTHHNQPNNKTYTYSPPHSEPEATSEEKQSFLKRLTSKFSSEKKQEAAPEVAQDTQPSRNIENWYHNRSNTANNQPLEALTQLARSGNLQAQYQLGLLYQTRYGKGLEPNENKAMYWLGKAANQHNASAQYALALAYSKQAKTLEQHHKALLWHKRAAQNGDPNAQYSLGVMYATGDLVDHNPQQAQYWLKKAAGQGNKAARIALLSNSYSSPPQIASAMPLGYEQPKVTQISHQTSFQNPNTVTTNSIPAPHQGTQVHNLSRDTHFTPPHTPLPQHDTNRLGHAQAGTQSPQNPLHARAQSGDANSQLLLGSMYEDGEGGMPQNYEQAANWYRKAADQGVPQAQYNLGLLYEDGDGVKQDFYEAARWYRRSASNGFAEAQNNLGVLYILGKGVVQNKNKAEMLFREAAAQGDENAKRNLQAMIENS